MGSLICQNLSNSLFSKFGYVIELPESPLDSNKNQRWADISKLDFKDGQPVIDVLYSASRPLQIDQLEMHSNSSQTFLPLKTEKFIITVGLTADPKELQVFMSNGYQGVTLKAGIWHCSPIPIKEPLVFALLHRSPDVDLKNKVVVLKSIISIQTL